MTRLTFFLALLLGRLINWYSQVRSDSRSIRTTAIITTTLKADRRKIGNKMHDLPALGSDTTGRPCALTTIRIVLFDGRSRNEFR